MKNKFEMTFTNYVSELNCDVDCVHGTFVVVICARKFCKTWSEKLIRNYYQNMAFVSAVTGDDSTKKFMDVLQNDFKTLSLETKKKYPQIREVSILQLNNKNLSFYF